METRSHIHHAPSQFAPRSTRLIMAIVLCGCLGAATGADAATYYLNTTSGSDSNPGTSSAPWKTLSKVQSGAANGDTVVIQAADAATYAAPWPTHVSYRTKVLQQFLVTWTFDTEYPVGQFVTGDFWVVGPVKIVGINPPSVADSTGRVSNGSMLNPPAGYYPQGYDSSMPSNTYDASLNVAFGVSARKPLVLAVNSSLISTISVAKAGSIPQMDRAVVLTVLSAPAAPGSFRPTYCGTDKTVKFNKSALNYTLLKTLKPVPGTPALADVEAQFAAPWIEHSGGWTATALRPRLNMPNYGREMHTAIGVGALMLHLNFTNAQKEKLLCEYVQLGLDLYGVLANGGYRNWVGEGGQAGGRKWPILFAGLMLNDAALKSIGDKSGDYLYQNGYAAGNCPPDYIAFGEDDQTFYVVQADVDVTNGPTWNPDSRDAQRIPYSAADIGMPEWGISHSRWPYTSNKWWPTEYRQVAGPPFHGTALAALLTDGGKALWKHDVYFDYTDRYMTTSAANGACPGWRSMNGFTEQMWDAYRAQCGPIWPNTGSGGGTTPPPATTPVVLTPIGNKQVASGGTLTFTVSATGGSGPLTYSTSPLPFGASFASQTLTWTPGVGQTGVYPVTFTVTDGQTQDSETIQMSIVPASSGGGGTTPPPTATSVVLAPIGNKQVASGGTLTFTVSATGGSGPLTYSTSPLPFGAGFANRTLTWTPGVGQTGVYPVTFTATDGKDRDSETIWMSIVQVNSAPVLGAIGNQSVNEGQLLSFGLHATDADRNAIAYSATGLPSGASLLGGTFRWTPSYDQAGTYSMTFTASDGQAQDSETITITVANVDRPPVLAAVGNQTVNTGNPVSFSLSATDPDGDNLTYSAGTLPNGAALTGPTFAWTPTAGQTGSYPVTFTVSDGTLTASKTITITVAATNTGADQSAPKVAGCLPAAGAIQVSLNNLVTLHVTDDGSGVSSNGVVIRLNDTIVYQGDVPVCASVGGLCSRSGTKSDYRYIYQSYTPFPVDQVETIRVNATDRAGNGMNQYQYSFTTEMRVFGRNRPVSLLGGTADAQPVTACDAAGTIWVAWSSGPVGRRDIYVAKQPLSARTFQTPIRLATNVHDQCNPALAVGASGAVYVAWQDNRNGNWDIYFSQCLSGSAFSPETRVTNSNRNEVNPALAVDRQTPAHVYVAWEDDRNGNWDIYAASSATGFATSTSWQVTTDPADQKEPAMAVDDSGVAYIFWTDLRNGAADLYGAAAGDAWANVPIVNAAGAQTQPAVAAGTGGALHLVWTDTRSGNSDIYYALLNGLPSSPAAGVNLVDDSSGAEQTAPTLVCSAEQRVFVGWQDARHASVMDRDTDLYFAEVRSGAPGVNILVGDDGTNSNQSDPALGVDRVGQPYVVWTDSRRLATDIYCAAATYLSPTAVDAKDVVASAGATLGTDPAALATVDDVSLVVPPGACQSDLHMSISKIVNPQVADEVLLGSYDFGPSGIQFDQPVTVTIPYAVSGANAQARPYWYDSITGALSQQGITDVQTISIAPTLSALRFQTTHFTPFYLVEADAPSGTTPDVSTGGSGGGCAISPDQNGSPGQLLLPYLAIALIMLILRHRDKRNRLRLQTPS